MSLYQPAVHSDIAALVHLINRAYRGPKAASGWTSEATFLAGDRITAELLRADIAANPSASLLKWIGEPSDGIIGCVRLEPVAEDIWHLGLLAIDPDQQSGGLGRTLLAAAEEWAHQRGARRIQMNVINIRETLIAWYMRRGYVLTGASTPFPYGDERFGKPLRDDLCFVVLAKEL